VGEIASRDRIRVAFCLDSFAIGGTELNAVRTAEALDRNRFELCVFYLQNCGPLRSRYERLNVEMTHVPIPNLYSLRTAVQGVRLARLLNRANIDVVHSHDIYCNIFVAPWARLLSRCSIIASRRWGTQASRPELAAINRWSNLLAHRVLVNSSAVAEVLACRERVPRSKIVEIPNFVGASAFEIAQEEVRLAQRRAWDVPDRAFVIGIIARLSPVKNHVLLLRAIAQLDSRFHLVIVGDGPCRDELRERAKQLRIEARVHFAGEVVSPYNLHQFFDVSVLCSLSEGFPNSLIEAMAAARPVVATPVGGVTDALFHDVTGLLVPLNDAAPMAEALRLLERDSLMRNRLGEAGRESVRTRFSKEAVIEKLAALYETLANLRRLPRAGCNHA
jgi:glycosyltransferase involved in cell wall biosynthesis